MKVVIAPDSFKESLSAKEVAASIRAGFAQVFPHAEYVLLPVADGGEGTLAVLSDAYEAEVQELEVTGPLGGKRNVSYAFKEHTAFIEMAEVCGLDLIPREMRNPLKVSTVGVGELIRHAINLGATEILVGVGGSASNDGGIGMAAGMGYRFLDAAGNEVAPIGENLARITQIDGTGVPKALENVKIRVISDVASPLCGDNGATAIFGPQKGLPQAEIARVDAMLADFYTRHFGRIPTEPGSGAGGGMGAGLAEFLSAELNAGIEFVLARLKMQEVCQDADLIIVGEGRMDGQTAQGKAPLGVAKCAPKNVPVIAICGSVTEDVSELYSKGITAVFPSIGRVASLAETLYDAAENIERTARNVAALVTRGF
ncbi:glycerate kinase [Listeria sp. ILCC792]|uniref:glycerate kinase n=1 Tax=Listeria sp. ILCC792 TaxID=1918331 RepID=UPI000B587FC3|nr:glycerate kinase [Listeria sp. ILCC792]